MAAQPPRPPPNNLLFCGPPPALPHVLLLPSDATCALSDLQPDPVVCNQTNDINALHEINNVGVPTYEGTYHENLPVYDKDQNIEYQLPPQSYLRRTHSFDVSDIYAANVMNEIDSSALQHRRSEPDLSKYGLFAELTMECTPMQQPPLVLNNPFYDGSFALDPNQISPGMVVLPENYLAFEDSFVPAWDYKPEYLIESGNAGLYYDGIPLLPSNDPWSVYCNENAAFEYYSPNFETPLGEDGVHYTPLTDLDYAIPQYMSLPVVEQVKPEDTVESNCDLQTENQHNSSSQGEVNLKKDDVQDSSVIVSNLVSEDEKTSHIEASTNRGSSTTQSEESLNADISNDVTSSLAFVPSSKSSQRAGDTDGTSDDTSPCSTDYQEASALDLVQSLDELSCCDSNDLSQSRDDISPISPEIPKASSVVTQENLPQNLVKTPTVITSSSLSLSQVPSIPTRDQPQNHLSPTIPINKLDVKNITHETVSNATNAVVIQTKETEQCKSSHIANTSVGKNANVKTNDTTNATQAPPPVPPAVPTSWLAPKNSSGNQSNLVHPPQIQVQCSSNIEQKNQNIISQPPPKPQASAIESQPSCSFIQPQASHTSRLKPDKQPKEVEVSP